MKHTGIMPPFENLGAANDYYEQANGTLWFRAPGQFGLSTWTKIRKATLALPSSLPEDSLIFPGECYQAFDGGSILYRGRSAGGVILAGGLSLQALPKTFEEQLRSFTTTPAPPNVASSLLTSLISYWTLDEASGTRNDTHGTNHLSDNNTVTQASGKLGNAAQFTSANLEHLGLADNTDISTGDIDFTLAAWVYLDTTPAQAEIASKGGAVDIDWYLDYILASDRFRFYVEGGSAASVLANSFGAPSTATWYYVIAWHDATANTINIQVNNGTVDSTSHSGGVKDTADDFAIGRAGSFVGGYFNGRIDAVGFWKRVLTSTERSTLYNSGIGIEYPFV